MYLMLNSDFNEPKKPYLLVQKERFKTCKNTMKVGCLTFLFHPQELHQAAAVLTSTALFAALRLCDAPPHIAISFVAEATGLKLLG